MRKSKILQITVLTMALTAALLLFKVDLGTKTVSYLYNYITK